jgi:hypothetical protein
VNVGLREDLERLDLSDDAKQKLLESHDDEIKDLSTELVTLRTKDRRKSVETEVTELSDAGFKNQPGLLKFYRRVLLSDDQEPGTVLLSDSDMGLSGDVATGATKKEEKSTAEVLREFVKLLPRNDDGKLVFAEMLLSDQDFDTPDKGDEPSAEDKTKEARERLAKHTGQPVKERTRSRYGAPVGAGGGD